MIENIQHDYFIWEEKSSTEQKMKLENNGVNEEAVTMNKIKNDSTQKDWKDITEPKLRKKMRKKAYYLANKSKIKLQKKDWRDNNKEKRKITNKIWYESNKDKIKAYYEDNKEKIKIRKKNYYKLTKDKNKQTKKIKDKIYYQKNKDKIKSYRKTIKDKTKIYRNNNRDRMNFYINNKRKTDIQYKLKVSLRHRLCSAIKGNFKSGSAVNDLGCTILQLKSYLESKFQPGMTWNNWTIDGWHIDHIKPLSSFDLTDRNKLLEACHYTNLQPMWADENLSKGKKVEIFEKKV